jgi:para-aminobenzoate synthetase component I
MQPLRPAPVIERLRPEHQPAFAFERFSDWPNCIWLDSALGSDPRSRYSFLAADPCEVVRIDHATADPLARVERWLTTYATRHVEGLPPFQGGVAGYMAYEFGRCFERIGAAHHDEFGLPLCVLGLYDVVLAWDHATGEGWLISQGYGEGFDDARRAERARDRANAWLSRLDGKGVAAIRPAPSPNPHAMAHGLTAPQYETRLGGGWLGNFDSAGYRDAVRKAREYILAGDIFQVNLSQRLLCPARCDSKTLYQRLRSVNAAPFAVLFRHGRRTNRERFSGAISEGPARVGRNAPHQRNSAQNPR